MIVQCTKCSTKFKIADEKITSTGVKVRCSKCRHMFLVKREGAEELDSIFTSATKVAPAAASPPPVSAAASTPTPAFPLPAPPVPPPPALPVSPPLAPPKVPAKPVVSKLNDDLFSDLDNLPAGPPPPPSKAAPVAPPPAVPGSIPGVVPANAPDDPFAGIDLDAPTPGVPSTLPPPPPPPAGGDLFGSLGDPFAVAPAAPAAPPGPPAEPADPFSLPPQPTPPSVPPPPAPAADPFAALETASAPPSASSAGELAQAALEGMLSRDDPFGEAAPRGEAQEAPSGLQLDLDGRLTESPAPAPPPPRPAAPPPPPAPPAVQASPVEAKTVEYEALPKEVVVASPPGVATAYKIAFGVLAAVLALLLFVVYRSGGKPDLTSWHTYAHAFGLSESRPASTGSLDAVLKSNTTYRNRDGHEILVAWGTLSGLQGDYANGVAVTLSLQDENQRQAAKKTYPAGIVFAPDQVYEMVSPQAVNEAYYRAVGEGRHRTAAKDGQLPFMIVFFDHPSHLEKFHLRVEAEPAKEPWTSLAPVPEAESQPKTNPPDLQPVPKAAATPPRTQRLGGDIVRLSPNGGQPRSP